MHTIKLYRHWQDQNQTFGNLVVFDNRGLPIFSSSCLERGWRNNQIGESCVPAGVYEIVLEYSPRFKTMLWEMKNVPGRTECKIHVANTWQQLNGCICLGIKLKDINKDGYIDVTNSRDTVDLFHRAMKPETKARIIIKDSK